MAKKSIKPPKGVRPKPKNPWKRYGETYSHSPDWSDACGPITESNGYSSADIRELTEAREEEGRPFEEDVTPPQTSHQSTSLTAEEARIELLAQQEDLRNWYHKMEGMEDLYENEYNI